MPAKKNVSRKSSTKKLSAKKTTTKSIAARQTGSSVSRPFMQTKFTEQTIYWLIIGGAVVFIAFWVLSIQVQINKMYDLVDTTNSQSVVPPKKTVQ